MPSNPLLLIDLSSALYPLYHMSGKEPDPNWTSTQTLSKIHMLSSRHQTSGVAVCADAGRSFRKDLAPTYKANRPDKEEPLIHQLRLTEEALIAQGYPVWRIPGYEADDVIASAVKRLTDLQEIEILIASSDKDLMQLIGPRVQVVSLTSGVVYDEIAAALKFHGVKPEQMIDYQIMVGDSADNIKGIPGIGPKRAAALLQQHGSLDALYEKMRNGAVFDLGLTPALRTALVEAKPEIPTLRALVTLRRDLDLDVSAIFQPRTPAPEEPTMDEPIQDDIDESMPTAQQPLSETETQTLNRYLDQHKGMTNAATMPAEPSKTAPDTITPPGTTPNGSVSCSVTPSAALTVLPPAGTQWERELEPRNESAARTVAKFLHDSRLFSAYGSPQAIYAVMLSGREFGLGSAASLRAFHVIDGKATMAADFMRSLVLRSGLAEYFTCTERTSERATFATHRKGDPREVTLTYTMDEALQAGVSTKPGSGWVKNKPDMLVARSSSKLARLVYPDVCFGLYSAAELGGDEL
jgi:5'-3' exonuclease